MEIKPSLLALVLVAGCIVVVTSDQNRPATASQPVGFPADDGRYFDGSLVVSRTRRQAAKPKVKQGARKPLAGAVQFGHVSGLTYIIVELVCLQTLQI